MIVSWGFYINCFTWNYWNFDYFIALYFLLPLINYPKYFYNRVAFNFFKKVAKKSRNLRLRRV